MSTEKYRDRSAVQVAQAQASIDEFRVLVTAEEAYPAFEHEFLSARREISASFRIFDLTTRLHSDEARKIGDTWFDLFVDTLNRGVAIRLVVTDFDPVAAPDLHQLAWRTKRQIAAVREFAAKESRMEISVALHDASVGFFPRLLLYPLIRKKLTELGAMWQTMSDSERSCFRTETPRLKTVCYEGEDGSLCFYPRLVDLHPATHHQKIAVFDRERLYIGGLDLNDRRYDTRRHTAEPEKTWHDIQALVTGRVVDAAQEHLDTFLLSVSGKAQPAAPVGGFLRTLSRPRRYANFRISPHTVVSEMEDRHKTEIAKARKLIYLESQFLRHRPLIGALCRRVRRNPGLRLIVLLPAAPEDIAFASSRGLDARFGESLQVRCLSRLRRVFGPDRLLVVSPVQPRRLDSDERDTLDGSPLVYVHSKVSIFDDTSGILSSANLNGRSMRWDTEAGLHITDPEHVAELRRKVMGHWLPEGAGPEYLDPETAFRHWKELVDFNSVSPPESRKGFLVHYDSDPARQIAQPLPGMPEEIV